MSKLVRNKVIINKSSLDTLAELNVSAEKMNCIVVIGVLEAGTPMLGGKTVNPTPFYMVLNSDMFKEGELVFDKMPIGFTKAEVLEHLINTGKPKEI